MDGEGGEVRWRWGIEPQTLVHKAKKLI